MRFSRAPALSEPWGLVGWAFGKLVNPAQGRVQTTLIRSLAIIIIMIIIITIIIITIIIITITIIIMVAGDCEPGN